MTRALSEEGGATGWSCDRRESLDGRLGLLRSAAMSAFHSILSRLVEEDDAAGAIFVDDSGETVDLATPESAEQMRLLGAYAGIYLRQAQRFCAAERMNDVRCVEIGCRGLQLYAMVLREGYSLIVAHRRPTVTAISRRRMQLAARDIEREAFA